MAKGETIDVAQELINKGEKFAMFLGEKFKETAPEVWQVAIRQAYNEAFADLIGPIGWLFGTFVYQLAMLSLWPECPQVIGHDNMTAGVWIAFVKVIPILSYVGGLIGLIWGLGWAIKALVNPKYYAFKKIVNLKSVVE